MKSGNWIEDVGEMALVSNPHTMKELRKKWNVCIRTLMFLLSNLCLAV